MPEYETVGTIEGVKVVRRISGSNKVPEESYTSKAYMTLYKDGNFQRLRIFDDSHKPKFDIDYHTEQSKYKNSPVLQDYFYVIFLYRKEKNYDLSYTHIRKRWNL